MKKLLSSLFLTAFCSFSLLGQTQGIHITYENPLGIEICGDKKVFRVSIHNNTENIIDANSILHINLPVGISYLTNSVSSNFIVATLLDLNNPDFIASNAIAVGALVTLEFQAKATCDSYAFIDNNLNTIKNQIGYSYSLAGINQTQIILNDTDNYNLSFRDIDLDVPIEVLNTPNQTLEFNNTNEILNQELDITIPGNSIDFSTFQIELTPSDELEFVGISELLIGTTNYSVSSVVISNTTTSPTTKLIFNAPDIDSSITGFCASMLIKVKLGFRAKSCFEGISQHVVYESVISDMDGGNCVVSKSIGDFEFHLLTPNLSYTFDSDNGIDLCGNTSSVTYTINNEIDSHSPVYDISLRLSQNYGAIISNAKINDIAIDATTYSTVISPLSVTVIPGLVALTDEDGDGDFDDLAPGATLVFTCDVLMTLPASNYDINNCNSGLYETYFSSDFHVKTSACDTDFQKDNLRTYFNLRDITTDVDLNVEDDLDDGQTQHVQFCITRAGAGYQNQIYDDNLLFEATIDIPCGTQYVDGSGTFTSPYGENMSSTVSQSIDIATGITTLTITVDEPFEFSVSPVYYDLCFDFDIVLDCDSAEICSNEGSFIEATAYGAFSECTSEKINMGCAAKELYLHCMPLMPSCPTPYPIIATGFEAKRTSFGTTPDGTTQITIDGVDNGFFTGLNTQGAYACDTIRTDLTGTAVCNLDINETFYGYIKYTHPEGEAYLGLQNAEFSIAGGNYIPASGFAINSTLSTSTETFVEVSITGQTIVTGDIIQIRTHFKVAKYINGNPSFSNVNPIENFRSGFTMGQYFPSAPFHYGTDFDIYKLTYSAEVKSVPATCSEDGNYAFNFDVSGGYGNDFPNELRNVVQIVGPVEINVPATIDGAVTLYNPRYFIGGISVPMPLSLVPQGGGVFRINDNLYGSSPDEFRPIDKKLSMQKYRIYVSTALNDCNLADDQTIDATVSLLEQGYTEEPCKEVITPVFEQQIVSSGSGFNIGDLSLDVVNPFFQTVDSVTRYKIDVNNISLQQAKYPWIKFTYPDNLITINNSTIGGYDIVGEVYGTDTLLLKLQPINAGTGMEGFIDVILNNCDFEEQNIDIQIETGISCGVISDKIINNEASICPLDSGKKVELEIIKSNLRMDVIPLFDTNIPLQYCNSFQYVVQIFNNEKASVTNPNFQIDLPIGFDMSVQYRYPVLEAIDPTYSQFSNSGFSSPINITSGQTWELIGTNGVLPGYIANQSECLNNYYQLLVTLTPTCGYDGVSSVNFSASGMTNCNENKEINFQSTPMFSELAVLNNYSHQLSVDVQQNIDLGNYTAVVHYSPDTDISGTLGILNINLPNGIYSTDNLNFNIPSNGATDFIFDFTTDPEYCGDVSFLINTIIDIELSCDNSTPCISRFEFEDLLTENVCVQDCVIENVDIESIAVSSCLNYNFNAVISEIIYGEIVSYNWTVTDINNNLVGNYLGDEIEVDLPNVGAPFTVVLNVSGVNNIGSVCEAEQIIILTPNCKPCAIDSEFTILRKKSGSCNSVELIPNITVFNGEITSYIWSVYNEQGIELETILLNTSTPEVLVYEFLENGEYKVCLEVNSINKLGEPCNARLCKKVVINCKPCNVIAKFSTQKISDCTYQFINYSAINNSSNVEYLWDFGDGNTSAEFEPLHTYTTNGYMYVNLTITALNSVNDSCKSTFGPLKIETKRCSRRKNYIDISTPTSVSIFPNPNNGIFTLNFNNYIKSCEVSIYDVLGKMISHRIVNEGNKFFIDISNCDKGVYLVKVSNETINKTTKIVIN